MLVNKVKKTEKKPEDSKTNSNESSSDTEKTSGSLFNINASSIEPSRIKELPSSFYKGYASLDEFLSATSASDNTSGNNIKSQPTHLHPKRHHGRSTQAYSDKKANLKMVSASIASKKSVFKPVTHPSAPKVIGLNNKTKKGKHKGKGYAQDAIDEMNRQYDHNLCLDRFMNDIEQCQKEQQQENATENVGRCKISPSNSSMSSCSSALPQSMTDTDSGSRNSDSIKSSTPENVKNDKENNNSGNNSSNSSSSGKDDKTEQDNQMEKKMGTTSKSSTTIEGSSSDGSKHFSSLESGVVVDSGATLEQSSAEKSIEKTKNYKGGKLGRKRKRGYIYNPKPVIEKPPKQFVPEQAKDQSYWDKRQRNNEAARRSREMRRQKEKETHDKLVRLKKENEALRVAITLLIQRNENLELVIDEFDKADNQNQNETPTVPVTC